MVVESVTKGTLGWLFDLVRKGVLDPALLQEVEALREQLAEHERNKAAIDHVLGALGTDERGLWASTQPNFPFPDYQDRIARSPPRGQTKRRPIIITTLNYKGGVGKTTTTANLAAYFDLKRGLKVLLIDLDYQGSLTTTLQPLTGVVDAGRHAGAILGDDPPAALLGSSVFAVRNVLTRTSLVPSFYGLARIEERLMIEWLLQRANIDARYRLARFLLDDDVAARFDVILIDGAPRLTTATINALTASSFVLVPAIMNPLSVEPVANFVVQTQLLMNVLNPKLSIVGVLETMAPPSSERQNPREAAILTLKEALRDRATNVTLFNNAIRRKPALTEGAVAYPADRDVKEMFDDFGNELMERIGP